jgi:hypothetical protein
LSVALYPDLIFLIHFIPPEIIYVVHEIVPDEVFRYKSNLEVKANKISPLSHLEAHSEYFGRHVWGRHGLLKKHHTGPNSEARHP